MSSYIKEQIIQDIVKTCKDENYYTIKKKSLKKIIRRKLDSIIEISYYSHETNLINYYVNDLFEILYKSYLYKKITNCTLKRYDNFFKKILYKEIYSYKGGVKNE